MRFGDYLKSIGREARVYEKEKKNYAGEPCSIS